MKLIPAILAGNLQEFKRLLRIAEELTDQVQIDLMDGDFVPTKSITAEELKKVSTSLKSEAHLMVRCPEDYIPALKRFGAQKVTFHYEAVDHPRELADSLRGLGFSVGVALNPETPVTALDYLIDEVDSVLFLAVDPGSYGHQFLPEVLDKVRQLRAAKPEAKIGVDGGVKRENIDRVLESGADFVYVGSAIFLQPDPRQSYLELKARVEATKIAMQNVEVNPSIFTQD